MSAFTNKTMLRFLFFFLLLTTTLVQASDRVPLNEGWEFHFSYDVRQKLKNPVVTLPHTWNAGEVAEGKMDYTRTSAIYIRNLHVGEEWKDKRLFLWFDGVNSVADVFVNQKRVGSHHGGYTAFCLEITPFVRVGADNKITVQVSNEHRLDVLPLTGDFNVYGGIHRPVTLLVKEANCLSPLDYATSGVYVTQTNVSRTSADVRVAARLSLQKPKATLKVHTRIVDAAGKTVAEQTSAAGKDQLFSLKNPHLWQAKADPYLYSVRTELVDGTRVLDSAEEPLGLRYYYVDPEKGFFLNGTHLDLHGFGYHEDMQGKGSAYTPADYEADMKLVLESGATAVRLTHYPHGKYWYELCDRAGIVVWSEIPLVGPGGYTGMGYVKSAELEAHGRQVMTEMIRQRYNHPSVCFWGLFNELKLDYDDPVPFVTSLGRLAKKEDPTRLTTCASFLDNPTFNGVSDLIAWNKYYGWYGGKPEQIGAWADKLHAEFPRKPIGVSEYGAGASPEKHTEDLKPVDPSGRFHPEEWQTYYHEKNWEELQKRDFVWGKYVWVLADFGSSIRTEGDHDAINDKGLVSYDRRTRKDAFYFYKANWSSEPFVYLAERRNRERTRPQVPVKVFANVREAELFVNGVSQGIRAADGLHRITWPAITLKPGANRIDVRSGALSDTCEWQYVAPAASRND
ncbi:beta-galactosidase [Siphonobacter aquaeclarae]|uniref:Beta-galactosidase n=2 Tax=Siphonobacter aquaeclarae TaxID=563176 RepID=A0A1G9HJ45_9BACT|nr:beta-galactosidase [Siphonobacter aquaeclarae]